MDKTEKKTILNKKEFFTDEINKILNLLSFNIENLIVAGSYGLRSMKYASDIDLIEPVNINSGFINELKKKIKNLMNNKNIFLGDIKLGAIKDFEVIDENAYVENNKIYGYNYKEALEKLEELKNNKINQRLITVNEFNEWRSLLKEKPNIEELEIIKKEIRPHILRWKPEDIIKGFVFHRGQKYKINDVIREGLFKIDLIALLNDNKFQEISIIYDIRKKNIRESKFKINPLQVFKNDINYYKSKKKYFKVLKRLFSYFSKTNDENNIKKLFYILNSDLGILNQIINDIESLLFLLEEKRKIPIDRLKDFIDNFINRLNNIYIINDYLKSEKAIINLIYSTLNKSSKKQIKNNLEKIKLKLENILNKNSKKYIKDFKLK